MSTDPDQIREDIERTRAELSSDVDALTDKVSPTQAAQRQAERLRATATGVKERVMGGASNGADGIGSAASAVGELPDVARSRTRGNPLAAGLIAFGAGWLVSSLLPSTRPEQQLARSAKEQAAPLVQEAKQTAQGLAQDLDQPARDAAAAVKERATEAGSTLKDEGRSAAQDLRADASDAAQNVRGTTD
jgi:cell division septum initiation protein DivIVA